MNKCLSDNQKLWKDRVGLLEKKIDETIRQKEEEMKELQDQVRDLMFYLETQKKIAESPEDKRQVQCIFIMLYCKVYCENSWLLKVEHEFL